jgi:spermidine synthase
MTSSPIPGAEPPAARRYLPWLLLLFVGSGCSALIYEVVWLQLLQLVIGSSAVSLAVLLGTFMGGMCLGSLALPRLISAGRHPLRVYATIELCLGLIGVAVLFAMPLAGRLYAAHVAPGFAGILLRGAVCAVCLLPPTVLMGATLPAIARWIETTPQSVSWLGFFYGGNIAGAVGGCLLAGFYLLRVYDMVTGTLVAAAINITVASVAFGLATRTPHTGSGPTKARASSLAYETDGGTQNPAPGTRTTEPETRNAEPGTRNPKPNHAAGASGSWPVYVAIALSGLCALGAEVIWTRLLSLMLGATVYTFSIILAVFLVGLGVGSGIGALLARTAVRPRLALGCCQALLVAAIAWTAYVLACSLPYWPIDPTLSTNPWFTFQLDLLRCAWAILPAAGLWGASFPLALAAVATPGQDAGRLVGGVYAANTVGAIMGAVAFSLVFIPWIGTLQSQRLLVALAAGAAVLLFVALAFPARPKGRVEGEPRRPAFRIASVVLAVITLCSASALAGRMIAIPGGVVAYGRSLAAKRFQPDILYLGEGMNASIAVTQSDGGVRNFHVSGKIEASTEPQDMRLQRMLGHMSALLHRKPKSVLVVGCGAGVTAGSFVLHPDVERIVICEIEPLIPRVVAQYFGRENYNVVHDPRVQVVYDDARHFILTTREKFDVITSDPIHPWVKGAATLYTREYFELCKQRLNPGGVVTQWVPLYESSLAVVKSEIATFCEAFPSGTIWSNDINGEGYDVVLLGQTAPMQIEVDGLQQRLDRPDHRAVAQSLKDVGFGSAIDLLATYAGQGSDLQPWLKGAEINRDRNLRLQYLAGMGINAGNSGSIYADMLRYRKYPEALFVASTESDRALRRTLGRPAGQP